MIYTMTHAEWEKYVNKCLNDFMVTCTVCAFKVGDSVRYKTMPNIQGKITEIDGSNYVIDNCLVLKSSEMEYKNVDIPVQSLPWGNKQKCNCDWNEVLRYGCKNPNHC
jgi:hypothetical protein